LIVGNSQTDGPKQLRFRRFSDKDVTLDATGREVRIRAWPVAAEKRMTVEVEMIDAIVYAPGEVKPGDAPQSAEGASEPSIRGRDILQFSVPMTADIQEIGKTHNAAYYAKESHLLAEQRGKLKRELLRLSNSIQSELHARASFSLSCLIL